MGKTRKGVRKVQHRSGRTTWQARWYAPDGKRRAENFATAGEAEAKLDAVQAAKRRREYEVVVPKNTKSTVEEWTRRVAKRRERSLRPSTAARDSSLLTNLVLPHLGDIPLADLSITHIEDWADHLQRSGYANDTINKAHQIVRRALDAAMAAGDLTPAPILSLHLRPDERHEPRLLTHDDVWELAGAIRRRYRAMPLLGAYGGLRWGEAAGLQRRHIDLTTRTVTVIKTLLRDGTLGEPKTKAARRTIVLPRLVIPEIATHLSEQKVPDRGLVFTAPKGGPLSYPHFRTRVWIPAVKSSIGEPARFHDLRHSHAAHLIEVRQHAKVIQTRLGHADIRVTMDTYGHLMTGLDEAAADALDSAWESRHGDAAGTQDQNLIHLVGA